jgi:hypothetical protein
MTPEELAAELERVDNLIGAKNKTDFSPMVWFRSLVMSGFELALVIAAIGFAFWLIS